MTRTWRDWTKAGVTLLALVGLIVVTGSVAAKEKREVIERFQANAIDMDTGRATMITIEIFAWDTDEERQGLLQVFQEKGNRAVYDYLGKQDEKGFLQLAGMPGYQMRYAYQSEANGKRYVVLGTDRPIGFGEAMRGAQSQDYNLTLVWLELDPTTGEGTGEMAFGAEMEVDRKTGQLKIGTAGNPTRFTKVKTLPLKKKKKKD